MSIAPYHAVVIPAGKEEEIQETALALYGKLQAEGVEALLDDRDERPGVKFKDADLLGIPLRIVVGKKGLAEGKVELKARKDKELSMVAVAELVPTVVAAVNAAGVRLMPRA
jgi:prolyl-tRNA synthetase